METLDINHDGKRDVRVRFSIEELGGYLNRRTRQLRIWGTDQRTGELYRGTADVVVLVDLPAHVLWDNGGFVTHPGAGFLGADVSMADPVYDSAGALVTSFPSEPEPYYQIADDFTVPAGGWTLGSVVTYAYRPGAGADPFWHSARLEIRSGSLNGAVVASTTTTEWEWSGVYRVLNGPENLPDAQRPVFALTFDLGSLALAAGTYWIRWQVVGPPWESVAWAPYATDRAPGGGFNTITVFENGRLLEPHGWEFLLDRPGAETPFLVLVPAAEQAPVRARRALE